MSRDRSNSPGKERRAIEIKPKDRLIALLVAVPGIAACVVLTVRFMLTMQRNGLVGVEHEFHRDHYLAVGSAYAQAFAIGFFFCLFMVVAAMAVWSWLEERKKASASRATMETRAPSTKPAEQES